MTGVGVVGPVVRLPPRHRYRTTVLEVAGLPEPTFRTSGPARDRQRPVVARLLGLPITGPPSRTELGEVEPTFTDRPLVQ